MSPPGQPSRYFIGVASREHVQRGVEGGFCQLCHGKAAPLKRMRAGDWIAYYSGKESLGGDAPCQRFTALGRVREGEPYPFDMGEGFVPFRRDVDFLPAAREVDIRPLLPSLAFIPDKARWGYPFRRGYLEVSREDFALIARAMLGEARAAELGLAGPGGIQEGGGRTLPASPGGGKRGAAHASGKKGRALRGEDD